MSRTKTANGESGPVAGGLPLIWGLNEILYYVPKCLIRPFSSPPPSLVQGKGGRRRPWVPTVNHILMSGPGGGALLGEAQESSNETTQNQFAF